MLGPFSVLKIPYNKLMEEKQFGLFILQLQMTTTKKPLHKFYIVFVGFQRENLKTEFEIKLTL